MDVQYASIVLFLFTVCVETFHVQVGKLSKRCQCRRRGRRMTQYLEEIEPVLEEMCSFTRLHCNDEPNPETTMGRPQHQGQGGMSMSIKEYILASQASKLTDALKTLCQTGRKLCEPTVTRKRLYASPWRLKNERRRVQNFDTKTSD